METTSVQTLLVAAGSLHGVFLASLLFGLRRGNGRANQILGLLCLVIALDLGVEYLYQSRQLATVPKLIFIQLLTSFAYGPLCLAYVRSLTSSGRAPQSRRHWLVPLLAVLLAIPLFAMNNTEVHALVYGGPDQQPALGLWALAALSLQLAPLALIGGYLWLSLRELRAHGERVRQQYSSLAAHSLRWLQSFLWTLSALYGLYVASVTVGLFAGGSELLESLLNLSMVIAVYGMGYRGLRQPSVFVGDLAEPQQNQPDQPGAPSMPKYQRSALDEAGQRALWAALRQHMEQERPYLDPQLTLSQLAAQLGISTNYLSQVINQESGGNFYDFVNGYRVETAKLALRAPRSSEQPIHLIGAAAGFNSRSAFYSAFKQLAHCSPGEYRRQHIQRTGC